MQELTKSITCNNISKKYNHSRIFSDCRSTIALANITFSVSRGEILGIIGKLRTFAFPHSHLSLDLLPN